MSLCSLLGAFEHWLSCLQSHRARTFHGKREAANILPTVHTDGRGFCFCSRNCTLCTAEAGRHMISLKAGSSVTVETGHQLLL